MGTRFRIVLYATSEAHAKEASEAAFAEINRINGVLSDYDPDSELTQFCAKAGEGHQSVSETLHQALILSQRYHELTAGAFDITVGPVIRLWRRAREEKSLPDPKAMNDALALVGSRYITLGMTQRRARLEKAGMLLDFGGIGKGFACDRALDVLEEHGVKSAMIDSGSGMALGEPPPERPMWTIRVGTKSDDVLLLCRCGVATSGDMFQFVEIDGTRYSHIVDPRNGKALTTSSMVTVVSSDATRADALSTAVSVLGSNRGIQLVEEIPGTEVLFKWVEGDRVRRAETKGFKALLMP